MSHTKFTYLRFSCARRAHHGHERPRERLGHLPYGGGTEESDDLVHQDKPSLLQQRVKGKATVEGCIVDESFPKAPIEL